MKKIFGFLFFCMLSISLSAQGINSEPINYSSDLQYKVKLDSYLVNWEYKIEGDADWKLAKVPGKIENSLFYKLDSLCRMIWFSQIEHDLETKDIEYRCSFNMNQSILQHENREMIFEGLDTYADVYLNDSLILHADNAFRTWRINVNKFVTGNENKLRIFFPAPAKRVHEIYGQKLFPYPADNEEGNEKISPFIRKAPYQFGWDISPRIISRGITGEVWFVAWSTLRSEIPQIIFQSRSDSLGKVLLLFELEITQNITGNIVVHSVDGMDSLIFPFQLKYPGKENTTQAVAVPLIIHHPQLWWPNGMGKQKIYRYNYKIILPTGFVIGHVGFGFRELELIREQDLQGESFYFKVNEVPVFCKGANWVAEDASFNPQISRNLKKYFELMKDAGFNMIRVWGGGVYPSDEFYDLADEFGIFIWQDFMFSGTMYPSDSAFLENIRIEAEQQVDRLRNHPSLALWCGNNEIKVAWENWGWQKKYKYSEMDSISLLLGYQKIFEELLPSVLKKHDPYHSYLPSSPVSNWGKQAEFNRGDNHYWGVYHGEEWFDAYKTHVPRFASEYGFQSFPSMWTLRNYLDDSSLYLASPLIQQLQKSYKGNGLLTKYMLHEFGMIPQHFENYVLLSQVLQGKSYKTAIESQRGKKPFCMGSLYWQFNDCWLGITWSTIDFEGMPKASWYSVKEGFKTISLIPEINDSVIKVIIVSDSLSDIQGWLKVSIKSFSGKVFYRDSLYGSEIGNFASLPFFFDFHLPNTIDLSRVFVELTFSDSNKVFDRAIEYFVTEKELKLPPVRWKVELLEPSNGSYLISIFSKRFAKNVNLYCLNNKEIPRPPYFSENNFDLLPGEKKVISFQPYFNSFHFYPVFLTSLEKLKQDRKPQVIHFSKDVSKVGKTW